MSGSRISRRSDIASFIAMDVMASANALEATGREVMHLEVGQPGAPAPASVLDAAAAALRSDRLGYTDALGRPSLRARIARHYGEIYGVDLDANRVVVTTGSSGAFLIAFLAMFDAGARVALTEPGYPAYRNILSALGVEPVGISVGDSERWQITPQQLREVAGQGGPGQGGPGQGGPGQGGTDKAGLDGLLIASPANPTGTVLTGERLAQLVETCRELGITFISDEIYHGLTYDGAAQTALALSDEVIVINSFSKYYCMTGWRVGWMVVPPSLVRVAERLAQNLFISPPTLSQIAAEAAFDALPELDARRDIYKVNRDLLIRELGAAGLDDFAPSDGAFYLYVNISRFSNDSVDFSARMLAEIGVATTPGIDFDPQRGSGFLRLSYAGEPNQIAEAAKRLRRWLD